MIKKFLVVRNNQNILKHIPVIIQIIKKRGTRYRFGGDHCTVDTISEYFARNRDRFQKRLKAL